MIWYSFAFGFVTGLCSVFMVGGCFFYVHLRPYLKSAKAKKANVDDVMTADMWLKQAGMSGLDGKRKRKQ